MENDTVGLSEPKSLVDGGQGIALWSESREDCWVDGTSLIVNDGESGSGIFGHGHAATSKYAIGRLVGNLDAESQPIANSHRLYLLLSAIQNSNTWSGSLGSRSDTDHVGISYRHHAEGNIPRGGVVGTPDLVDLVGFGHHHAMSLDDYGVGVDPSLTDCNDNDNDKPYTNQSRRMLTTDWVLQSWPLIVRSSLNESLLMTSTLQVSDLPRA